MKKEFNDEKKISNCNNIIESKNKLIDINVMNMIEYYLVKHSEIYQYYKEHELHIKYLELLNKLIADQESKFDINHFENMMLQKETNMITNEDIIQQIVTTFCLINLLRKT